MVSMALIGFLLQHPSTNSTVALPPISTWHTYPNSIGRLSVAFPGEPTRSSELDTLDGVQVQTSFLLWGNATSTSDATVVLEVTWSDYPVGHLSGQDPTSFFDAKQATDVAANWTLVSSREMSICGGAGREVTQSRSGVTVTLRECIVGDRWYVVAAGGTDTASAQVFLDSFQAYP